MSVLLIPDPRNAPRLILEMLLAEKSRFGERGRVLFPHIISFCTEPPRVLFKSLPSLCKVTVDSHTRRCSYHPPAQHGGCLACHHFYATPQRPGLSIIIKEGSGCRACLPSSSECYLCVYAHECVSIWVCLLCVLDYSSPRSECDRGRHQPDAVWGVLPVTGQHHGSLEVRWWGTGLWILKLSLNTPG